MPTFDLVLVISILVGMLAGVRFVLRALMGQPLPEWMNMLMGKGRGD